MAEVKIAKTSKVPSAKGGARQGGNKVHGSIAGGRGQSPAVITSARK